MLLLLNESVGEMAGGNEKKVYQSNPMSLSLYEFIARTLSAGKMVWQKFCEVQ